ncbi:hypothetical protein EG68_12120, partial [Paragonimus skrjabini miyazakii]
IGAWTRPSHEAVLYGRLRAWGDHQTTLKLSTYNDSISTVTLATSIHVINPFESEGLVSATFALGEAVTLELKSTPETPNQYRWNFGDGTAEIVTTNRTVNHTFNQPGQLNISINLTDGIDYYINKFTVYIVGRFEFNGILASPTRIRISTVLSLNATFGPDVQCEWTIDGTIRHVGSQLEFQYVYADLGQHSVRVKCSNAQRAEQREITQLVVDPLEGTCGIRACRCPYVTCPALSNPGPERSSRVTHTIDWLTICLIFASSLI